MSTTTAYPSFKPTFAPYHSTFTTPMTPTKSSSQRRKVRFTFGYNNNKDACDNSLTWTSTSSTLPPSHTLTFDQHLHKYTSVTSHDINEKEDNSSFTTTAIAAPTTHDLIPIRTSSITSSSAPYSPVSSVPAPSSRCSSMNSGISFTSSLNHRTMPRPQHQSSSLWTENRNKRSHSPPATSRSPSPTHDLDAPSAKESQVRSAFLSSPPVRSRVTRRNICQIPTKCLVSASSTSLMNSVLSSTSKCCPLSVINLDKRRWSNDSTRGLNGMSNAFLIENYEPFPSTTSQETKRCKPSSSPSKSCFKSTKAKAVSHHGYLESAPSVSSSTEVSSKKRCKTLSLFSFMKRT
ncbi:hypothetical protein BGZ81_005661 [Podila clonocystis]|nr:hypothetical protein BGZ81_005661 [Podila clonocystis]